MNTGFSFLDLIRDAGQALSRLNEKFYFYIYIDTTVSWAIILLMVLIYYILKKFVADKKLTGEELIKLMALYLIILLVIAASYVDVDVIFAAENRKSTFMVVSAAALILVYIIARLGVEEDARKRMKYILIVLYTPIILLIVSNGRILEDKFESIKDLMPRSQSVILPLEGEVDELYVGGTLNRNQIQMVETYLERHYRVKEAAVVAHKDYTDGFVKPYAFIVFSQPGEEAPETKKSNSAKPKTRVRQTREQLDLEKLKEDILSDCIAQMQREGVSRYLYPHWVEPVRALPKKGKGNDAPIDYQVLKKLRRNWSNYFHVPKES